MGLRPSGRGGSSDQLALWALDSLDEAVLVFNSSSEITLYSKAAANFFGAKPRNSEMLEWEQSCGLNSENLEKTETTELPWRRVLRGEHLPPTSFLLRNDLHPSGLWVTATGWSQTDPDGAITAALVSLREKSMRSVADLSRAHWESRFTQFMRYLPGVAFIKDASGRYLFFSESSLTATGMQASDVVGKMGEEFWAPEFIKEWRENDLEVLRQGKAVCVSESVPAVDGVHRWTVYKFPIPDERGDRVLIGGIGLDDSERRQFRARLHQAEKMEAIGRLAGGVAHDFNNLLTVIAGYGQMLQDALDRELPPEKMKLYLDELMSAGARAVDLTDQLLAFSRKKVGRVLRLDLREQIRVVERVLSRVIGEDIELRVAESSEPCYIEADPNQIGQIILNLAANARDVMPEGGTLTMRTSVAGAVPTELAEGEYVLLEVADSGPGTDRDLLRHMFEPFFASKSHGKGTGLGLPTVYGIVKQIGGEIVVTSEIGSGTTFRIYFPKSPKPVLENEKIDPAPPAKDVPKGHETILLVEDELTVRDLVKTMLESFGYRPLVAESGSQALEIFNHRGEDIDLLLTDVIMPQMSGRELATILQRLNPGLRTLYMSGYTADEIATQGPAAQKPLLLQKPFKAAQLARCIREVLDAPVLSN